MGGEPAGSASPASGPGRPESPPVDLPILPSSAPPAGPGLRLSNLPPPRTVERGVVLFDLDGTLLNDLSLISRVAADVLNKAFGTPLDEARIHYLATTGMPFEAQLAQLYPEAPAALRATTARTFHQRKIAEAYARAEPFPEVPKLLKRLAQERWTLAITTGAETEMADLILEREGLRYWFEGVLGSAEGTKREHLSEYARRFPGVPLFLVGDSRFDMEAAVGVHGVVPLARASRFEGWTLGPRDLKEWGAAWADYDLTELPEVLEKLARPPSPRRPRASARKKRRR